MKLWRVRVSLDVICDTESAELSIKLLPETLEKKHGVLKVHATIVEKHLLLDYDPHVYPGSKEPH